jgi:FMN phosphatase YigB (HAD superfamily)
MGVLSNWDRQLGRRLELLHPLRFDPVIGSMHEGVAKPSPELFDVAIQRSGVRPHEILCVGDSLRLDIEPSQEAGMQAVLLDRIDAFPSYPGTRISSLAELPALTES